MLLMQRGGGARVDVPVSNYYFKTKRVKSLYRPPAAPTAGARNRTRASAAPSTAARLRPRGRHRPPPPTATLPRPQRPDLPRRTRIRRPSRPRASGRVLLGPAASRVRACGRHLTMSAPAARAGGSAVSRGVCRPRLRIVTEGREDCHRGRRGGVRGGGNFFSRPGIRST